MRAPAIQGRPDANQADLATVYRACGCSVIDTHGVGFGFPDLVVGLIGVTALVEIKTGEGDFTAAQVRFNVDWRGSRVVVVRSVDDVIQHVQAIRRKAGRL